MVQNDIHRLVFLQRDQRRTADRLKRCEVVWALHLAAHVAEEHTSPAAMSSESEGPANPPDEHALNREGSRVKELAVIGGPRGRNEVSKEVKI